MQKLLLLAAILAAVWYGFKFLGRLKDRRDAEAKVGRQRQGGGGQARRESSPGPAVQNPAPVEELVQCPKCGAYVTREAIASGENCCAKSG